jgi:SAM-dependent methyltransferase
MSRKWLDGLKASKGVFRHFVSEMSPQQEPAITRTSSTPKPANECVICRKPVAAWGRYRPEIASSPFIERLDAIGSNIDRFSCPHCGSHDRERHLVLFFNKLNLWPELDKKIVLHLAPEHHLSAAVAAAGPAQYVMGDLFPSNESIRKVDIEGIAFPDSFFDLVICNHILEHVANVDVALAEVQRVLKSGGRFVCQTPFAARLSQTFEEPDLKSPEDRLFFYGQEDHVRLFGRDIEARIHRAGFSGRLVPHDEILGDVDPIKFGVNEREPFFDFLRADPERSDS